eukprot:CAMPEP_0114519244 /NCGR_PEP_ID=MMETSP0109-20121206/18893_1 /TAXON_ID=29199 /ORGANISM="Chlorarachnion reptans, Strain CCCM449" /LENGTH=398 /DNA_ID=CAMNT_0001699957 /DNA_START=67 /DNA_END=1263 /DNA_ORIENTATION=+
MTTQTDLEKAFRKAKKAWKVDKENKKLKKEMRAAKKAWEESKSGDAADEKEAPKLDVAALEKAFKKAKKAWKENKGDKALKKAKNEAKKAWEAAKASSESEEKTEDKSDSVDIESLKEAVKKARKEFKADKTNKAAKKALREAKKALEEAEAKTNGEVEVEEKETPTDVGSKRKREEEEEETKEEDDGANAWASMSAKKKQRSDPVEGEPNMKCFVGNLSWDIDESQTRAFFKDCGELTDIFWLTDRETERFKGCGFITFDSIEAATKACEKNGQDLMGRPLKINYAKPRPDKDRKRTPKKGGGPKREPSERPAGGTTTVFVGNLSFDIDDDAMRGFAKGCGEITNIRWLTDRDSGDFKGCGFIDFASVEGVDKFITEKNGSDLMGRTIRIDYAKPRV